MPTLNPVWKNELYVGTSMSGTSWVYSKLCAGIESMEFQSGEQNQQFFFLCGNGYAHNETTGSAPQVSCSGRRIVGDTAQDYIAGKQFALGPDRNTSVKIIAEGKQIICDATIGEVVSFGGSALDVNNFSCTLYFNGQPTMEAAPAQ